MLTKCRWIPVDRVVLRGCILSKLHCRLICTTPKTPQATVPLAQCIDVCHGSCPLLRQIAGSARTYAVERNDDVETSGPIHVHTGLRDNRNVEPGARQQRGRTADWVEAGRGIFERNTGEDKPVAANAPASALRQEVAARCYRPSCFTCSVICTLHR